MSDVARSSELDDAVIADFPLRGEWAAYHTPGSRIPSHGVDMLGQRFAFDFLRVDGRPGWHNHPAGRARSMLIGVRTSDCYGWGEPIHASLDGEVVGAKDGLAERSWIHPARELALVLKTALTFKPTDRGLHRVLGNHVITRSGDVYALFAHMAPGSVAVEVGQAVTAGEVIGRVGHTGNSTAPHLHFQLMNAADPRVAKGVPCAFRAYEVMRDGAWARVENAIPTNTDRFRSVPPVEEALPS